MDLASAYPFQDLRGSQKTFEDFISCFWDVEQSAIFGVAKRKVKYNMGERSDTERVWAWSAIKQMRERENKPGSAKSFPMRPGVPAAALTWCSGQMETNNRIGSVPTLVRVK